MVTAARRPLPEFLLIGGKRCGSTSLFRYVAEHPQVLPLFPAVQAIKGVHYFDSNFIRGESWYRSHFPTTAARERAARRLGAPVLTGEGSPYYLFHPLAAERAAAVVPDARILVVLRDPVDRAWSHYRERVRHGAESLSFSDALDAEERRLAGELQRLRSVPGHRSVEHEDHSYVDQGRYAMALEPWLARFARDRVHVVVAEELFSHPEPTYLGVLDFLGLAHVRPPVFDRWNFHPGDDMDPGLRRSLQDHLAPDNACLAELLDLDLSRWGWVTTRRGS